MYSLYKAKKTWAFDLKIYPSYDTQGNVGILFKIWWLTHNLYHQAKWLEYKQAIWPFRGYVFFSNLVFFFSFQQYKLLRITGMSKLYIYNVFKWVNGTL